MLRISRSSKCDYTREVQRAGPHWKVEQIAAVAAGLLDGEGEEHDWVSALQHGAETVDQLRLGQQYRRRLQYILCRSGILSSQTPQY